MKELVNIPENYQPQQTCLANKTILITGAGDGIGAVAAKTFANYGATVILLGKTIPKLEKVYDEIIAVGSPQPAIYPLNLEGAKDTDYLTLAETIEKEFGCLDGLLHNAAMFGGLIPIEQFDVSLWAQIVQINLHAPFLLSKALIPVMKKSQNASMVFTSSGVAHEGRAYWGAYGVTKAAGDNLMGILANELEVNTSIRVNSIDPGRVRTRMRALAFPGEDPNTVPSPEEIMNAYLYLMSDDSSNVNGEIVVAY